MIISDLPYLEVVSAASSPIGGKSNQEKDKSNKKNKVTIINYYNTYAISISNSTAIAGDGGTAIAGASSDSYALSTH